MYTNPLENLLPPDVLEPPIQISDLLHDILNFALILALDRACLADRQVQRQLRGAEGLPGEPAGVGRGVRGREADLVVAGVGGGEGEAP